MLRQRDLVLVGAGLARPHQLVAAAADAVEGDMAARQRIRIAVALQLFAEPSLGALPIGRCARDLCGHAFDVDAVPEQGVGDGGADADSLGGPRHRIGLEGGPGSMNAVKPLRTISTQAISALAYSSSSSSALIQAT